jgi:hypothetical protein
VTVVANLLVECWETTTGASTCIFKQLNSKASIGFDNITDLVKFCLSCSLNDSSASCFDIRDGLDTFAARTARTLSEK